MPYQLPQLFPPYVELCGEEKFKCVEHFCFTNYISVLGGLCPDSFLYFCYYHCRVQISKHLKILATATGSFRRLFAFHACYQQWVLSPACHVASKAPCYGMGTQACLLCFSSHWHFNKAVTGPLFLMCHTNKTPSSSFAKQYWLVNQHCVILHLHCPLHIKWLCFHLSEYWLGSGWKYLLLFSKFGV